MENYLLKHRHLEAGPCCLYLYEDEHDAPLETHTTRAFSSVLLALKPQQTCNADLRRLRPLPGPWRRPTRFHCPSTTAFLTPRCAPPPIASRITTNTKPGASSIPCSTCPPSAPRETCELGLKPSTHKRRQVREQTPHLLNLLKLKSQRKERRSNQDYGTLRPPKSVTTYLKTETPNQEERKSIGCNHISRFVGFPNPRPNGLRIRVLHLSSSESLTSQYT
jgi:hypothetical protein